MRSYGAGLPNPLRTIDRTYRAIVQLCLKAQGLNHKTNIKSAGRFMPKPYCQHIPHSKGLPDKYSATKNQKYIYNII